MSSNVRLNREQIAQLQMEILEGDRDDSPWFNVLESTVNVMTVEAISANRFCAAETNDDLEDTDMPGVNATIVDSTSTITSNAQKKDKDEFRSAGNDVRINICPIVIAGRRFVRKKITPTKHRQSSASRRLVLTGLLETVKKRTGPHHRYIKCVFTNLLQQRASYKHQRHRGEGSQCDEGKENLKYSMYFGKFLT